MKQLFILILSVMCAVANPVANQETFVIKREKFGKPLVWIRPIPDNNKQLPTDVFCDFMDHINSRSYAKAMALCTPFEGFGADRDPKVVSILNEKLFTRFVDGALQSAGGRKVIIVSEFAIKGKGGSWRVEYKIDGRLKMVDFEKINGVWKLCECPSWYRIVVAEPHLAENEDWAFP